MIKNINIRNKPHKDVLIGASNGYKFELYPTKRKNGSEHTPLTFMHFIKDERENSVFATVTREKLVICLMAL